MPINRRDFLLATLGLCCGAGNIPDAWAAPAATLLSSDKPFPGATLIGNLAFQGSGNSRVGVPFGTGANGRLLTDIEHVSPARAVTENDNFYIRSRAPEHRPAVANWNVKVDGLVARPQSLPLSFFSEKARPQGVHLLECSGNFDGDHRLISTAAWTGIPLQTLLDAVQPRKEATHVLVAGVGRYVQEDVTDVTQTGWIFPLNTQLLLATGMNGVPLPLDHGHPLRLVAPGCYGCCSIKWVTNVRLVKADEPVTAHMKEYADRTGQQGVPTTAADYKMRLMDTTAMPLRVEQWVKGAETYYRMIGIVWGGTRPAPRLQIRINARPWETVDEYLPPTTTQSWTFWYHHFKPNGPGQYRILLQAPDLPAGRIFSRKYMRIVDVPDLPPL